MTLGEPDQLRQGLWHRIRRSMWFPLVAVFVTLALIQGFAVKMYQIPSGSMEPTLEVGDRLLVNRLPGSAGEVSTGDIIAFEEPESWGPFASRSTLRTIAGAVGDIVGFGPSNVRPTVKRVIADAGERVGCCDDAGAVEVDGVPQQLPEQEYDFPFIPGELDCTTMPASGRCFEEFTVLADELFVLGDHRARSADSLKKCRSQGETDIEVCVVTVPRENVIGPVITRVWPLNRIGQPAELGSEPHDGNGSSTW